MSARSPRFHTDVRFVIGVALVIVAVAGVWGVVAAARTTTTVWVADRTLVPGDVIEADDLRTAEVGLGEVADRYVAATESVAGRVATRVVAAGEVVPSAALGDGADVDSTTVVVTTGGALAAAVTPGVAVELWATDAKAEDARPHLLVADATVGAVDAEGGGMIASGTTVELVIPRSAVTDVLAAQAAGAVLAVVPTTGAR